MSTRVPPVYFRKLYRSVEEWLRSVCETVGGVVESRGEELTCTVKGSVSVLQLNNEVYINNFKITLIESKVPLRLVLTGQNFYTELGTGRVVAKFKSSGGAKLMYFKGFNTIKIESSTP